MHVISNFQWSIMDVKVKDCYVHLTTLSQSQLPAPIKCGTCKNSFKIEAYLEIHQQVHTREKPYPCSKCKAKYSCRSGLTSHIRCTHERDLHTNRFECLVCQKTFFKKCQLLNHSKIHSDNQPVCSSVFASHPSLRYHRQDEWDKNKYSVCERKFPTRADLNRHFK
ncbi:putative zinc finger protein [Orchesella cincta]|uniref:Putative zinc finger protein n=1 Tax=Orchesella cincta TaxID=48709 RepID=A0A1D2M1E5_ORCCI|nr:putative zinc finger protein [Orchesella cincta]